MENVIDFRRVKEDRSGESVLFGYQKYIELLDSFEISIEAKHLASIVSKENLDYFLVQKAKILLREISRRTKFDHPHLSFHLIQMIKGLKEKLELLENLERS